MTMPLINELKNKGKTSLNFREVLSSKAFGLTAYYDSMIELFNDKLNIQFPERKTVFGRRLKMLRYGETHIKKVVFILMTIMIGNLVLLN